jgi:hypothetical protein
MHVKMAGHACTGSFTQIEADVKSVRMVKLAEDALKAAGQIDHFMGRRRVQFLQLVCVLVRDDHDVAGSIRIGIEYYEAVLATVNDAGLAVVPTGKSGTKDALLGLVSPGDIGIAPGGKNKVHVKTEDTRSPRDIRLFRPGSWGLTVLWPVAIVEGVFWHDQDCHKIRPLVFKLRGAKLRSQSRQSNPSARQRFSRMSSGVFKVR